MTESLRVKATPYQGMNIEDMVDEELVKAAIRGLNGWKDNLSTGRGQGSHGGPFVDTGEARASIHIETPEPGRVLVVGDVVQLFIAEYGRPPGGKMPPKDAIEDWVHRKGIKARGDPEFDDVVFLIRRSIALNGVKGFAPGRQAVRDSVPASRTSHLDAARRAADKAGIR